MCRRRSFVSCVVAERRDLRAVDRDGAGGRAVEAGEDVHERRLAGARGAHHGGQLAAADLERDAAERVDGGVARRRSGGAGRWPRRRRAARGRPRCRRRSRRSMQRSSGFSFVGDQTCVHGAVRRAPRPPRPEGRFGSSRGTTSGRRPREVPVRGHAPPRRGRRGAHAIDVLAVAHAPSRPSSRSGARRCRASQADADALVALLATLPLLLRRRAPLVAPLTVLRHARRRVAARAARRSTTPRSSFFGVLLATWTVGESNPNRQGVIGYAAAIGTLVLVVSRFPDDSSGAATSSGSPCSSRAAWLAGFAVGLRAEQARERARRGVRLTERASARVESERAVAEERRRIARELHDVVAHYVSRHDRAGRGRAAAAPRRPGARARGARRGRGDGPRGARGDAAPARRSCAATTTARDARAAAGAGGACEALVGADRATAASPSSSRVEGEPSSSRRASTCPPTGSCRRRSRTRSSTRRGARARGRPLRAATRSSSRSATTGEGADGRRRPRPRRHARARRVLRRHARGGPRTERRLRRPRAPPRRGRRSTRGDPRPDRRRPGARARRVPDDPRRRARHRGRRPRRPTGSRRSTAVGQAHDPTSSLMDIRMPNLDGIEATRRLVERSPTTARAHAHDLRPERVRLRGAARGRERVPAQGRAAGAARRRDPRGRRRRGAARPVDHAARDRGVRAPAAARARRPPERVSSLTARELEVLRLIARGRSNAEIADGARSSARRR